MGEYELSETILITYSEKNMQLTFFQKKKIDKNVLCGTLTTLTTLKLNSKIFYQQPGFQIYFSNNTEERKELCNINNIKFKISVSC